MSNHPQASARSRPLRPLIAAAAVVAVVLALIGGAYVLRSRKGPTAPPVLHLASVAGASSGVPAASAGGTAVRGGAPGTNNVQGSGWQLVGALPTGPATSQVRQVPAGPVTGALVTTLARALAMKGQPVHVAGGWYLVSGTTQLSVSELSGRQWVYTDQRCINGPVADLQLGADCAMASAPPPVATAPGGGAAARSNGSVNPPTSAAPVPLPTPAPLPASIASAIAGPVLAAVGINVAAAHVEPAGDGVSLNFSPTMAGLQVVGLDTSVSVGGNRQIVDATGWLATSSPGPTYPLISARAAYNQLKAEPQPMMALAMRCRIVAGQQGCLATPERVVTGATLGLTKAYSTGGEILLVPAWLFHLRGQQDPMTIVAVAGAYLGQPAAPPPGGKPAVGAGSGAVGGSAGTSASTGATPQNQSGAPAIAPSAQPAP